MSCHATIFHGLILAIFIFLASNILMPYRRETPINLHEYTSLLIPHYLLSARYACALTQFNIDILISYDLFHHFVQHPTNHLIERLFL